MALQSKLSLASLDNQINEMVDALAFIGGALFRLKVRRKAALKQEIEKNAGVTLPKFWGGGTKTDT